MHKLFLLFFVCCCTLGFGKEKYDCIYRKDAKTDATKKYPFLNADKIIWVQWKVAGKEIPKTISDFTGGQLNWDIFTDTISINSTNKAKLADILFNYKYTVKGTYDLTSKCYIPRDAVLFIDKNGILFDYVEMCFECTDYRLMTKKWKFDFCEGKLDLLAKYRTALFKK